MQVRSVLDLRAQKTSNSTTNTGVNLFHDSTSYNDDKDDSENALGEDDNAIEVIPTTDLPSTEDGREEVMLFPNCSNITESTKRRRNPLPLNFPQKINTLSCWLG